MTEHETYIPAGTCPGCGRKGFSETDASTRNQKGERVYRVYRRCPCDEYWEVEIDARTGRERVVQRGNRKKR
jgi:hypothetical protein